MCLTWLLILIKHLYFSGVWLDVALTCNTYQKNKRLEVIGLHTQYMIIIILSSIFNIIGEGCI